MHLVFQLVAVLLALNASLAAAFTFQIDANREECFYETITQGDSLGIMFNVVSGGFLDINLQVTAPDNTVALARRKESEGKYSLTAHTTGIYSICFSNQMSRLTPKEVDVEISVTGPGRGGVDDLAKKEHLDPLEQQILQLSAALSAVHNEQKYMKMRESRHRFTNDSTNSRVLWWSFFEAVILIGASLFQVYYLRRFFEQKTSL